MATDDDLRAIERRRLRSLVDADIATAMSLHADDYELITPGGQTLSKDAYLGGVAAGELRYAVFEPASTIRVRTDGGTAILRYQVDIEIGFGDEREAGRYWHTDYYELRDGRWQAVWSHATRTRSTQPGPEASPPA